MTTNPVTIRRVPDESWVTIGQQKEGHRAERKEEGLQPAAQPGRHPVVPSHSGAPVRVCHGTSRDKSCRGVVARSAWERVEAEAEVVDEDEDGNDPDGPGRLEEESGEGDDDGHKGGRGLT